MKLIDFYNKVLNMGIMEADDKGVVRLIQEHKPAAMIGDRIIVIPTQEQISNLNENKEVFHPLAEDTIAGLSNVSKKLLERINFSLNVTFTQIVIYLHSLATTSSGKTNYTSEQMEILQGIKAQPKKELDIMKALAGPFAKNPTNAFVEITLSRSGKTLFRGERVSRVAYVSFPFYNELKKDIDKARKDSTLGLTLEQVELMIEMYEAVFPNLDMPDEYNSGVGVVYAPFFTVLLKSAGSLFQAMMRLKVAFPDYIELTELTETDYGWLSILDNQEELRKLANQYPNLELKKNAVEKEPIRSTPTAVPTPPAPTAYAQPPIAEAPAPKLTAQQQYNPNKVNTGNSNPEKENRQSYEEWAAGRMGVSQMGLYGQQRENAKRHNEGYRHYWNQHIQMYGGPPANMPHPDAVPEGQLAPQYPNMPVLPGVNSPIQQPMQQPGYGVQQPMYPMQQQGYPVQQPMYPMQQPMQQPGYGVQQPMYPMQQQGYPVQQAPMGYGYAPPPLNAANGYRR